MNWTKLLDLVKNNLPKSFTYFGLKNWSIWIARQIGKSKILGSLSGVWGFLANIAIGIVFDKLEPYVRAGIAWARDKVEYLIDKGKFKKSEKKRKEGEQEGNDEKITDSFDDMP